jgi:hypothetical protein
MCIINTKRKNISAVSEPVVGISEVLGAKHGEGSGIENKGQGDQLVKSTSGDEVPSGNDHAQCQTDHAGHGHP